MRTLAYVVLLLVWSTCAAFAFAHRVADSCADCNSVAYSVQLRLQKELPPELVEVQRRVNETCSSVGCPRKTAKCVNIIEKYGAQLAAKVHEHKQTNALTLWKNTHLLAVQRLLCHDIASVCPSDMYDVGLHMEL